MEKTICPSTVVTPILTTWSTFLRVWGYEQYPPQPSLKVAEPYDHNFQGYDQYEAQPSINPSHPYDQNFQCNDPYAPQPSHQQNDQQYASQAYQEYESQKYASQQQNDQNTQGSNSWFNFFGVRQICIFGFSNF